MSVLPAADRVQPTAAAASGPALLRALWLAMRPQHLLKNSLILAPSALAVGSAWLIWQPASWGRPLLLPILAAALFSLTAAALYLINDVRDAEADRLHPAKRQRPVAAGHLPAGVAVATATLLIAFTLPLALALDREVGLLVTGYAALMLAYSVGLKRVPYMELVVVGLGFAIRMRIGVEAAGLHAPLWLDLSVLYAAFLLVGGKRRAELVSLGRVAGAHRRVLARYRVATLDGMLFLAAGAALVSYALAAVVWSAAPGGPALAALLSVLPFMAVGLARYLVLIGRGRGGDPVRVFLTDRPLFAAILGGGLALLVFSTAFAL